MKFNIFRRKQETGKTAETTGFQTPNWDSVKTVPFAGETRSFSIEKPTTLTQISSERADELLQKTEIDGDPFPINGEDHVLTTETLASADLAPQYETSLGRTSFSFSKCFQVQGHDACIAYVKTPDGKVKTRAYYRSNSAGLWRYCPDYGYNGGRSIWFGKGYFEEALTLPPGLQMQLNAVSEMDQAQPGDPRTADLCFFGTGKFYRTDRDHRTAKWNDELRGDYYRETPKEKSFGFTGTPDWKNQPEEFDCSKKEAPDYHQEMLSYNAHSKIYGDYTTRVYPSHDGSLLYSVCETEINGERRAWVSNIETTAPIGSTGCRTRWGLGGDFITPLYEYGSQDGGYGDMEDFRGEYVGMWKNYLSKLPLIKRYIKETDKEQKTA